VKILIVSPFVFVGALCQTTSPAFVHGMFLQVLY